MRLFLWSCAIIGIALPIVFLISLETTYTQVEFTATYQDREFNIAFEVPDFPHWKATLIDYEQNLISFEYVLPEDKQAYDTADAATRVSIEKTARTDPLTQTERENMFYLSGADVLYTEPLITDDGNYAETVVVIETLPGFYLLRAPVNFTAPCNDTDTHTIVSSILGTLAPAKNYRDMTNLEIAARIYWNRSLLVWPEQKKSCF